MQAGFTLRPSLVGDGGRRENSRTTPPSLSKSSAAARGVQAHPDSVDVLTHLRPRDAKRRGNRRRSAVSLRTREEPTKEHRHDLASIHSLRDRPPAAAGPSGWGRARSDHKGHWPHGRVADRTATAG